MERLLENGYVKFIDGEQVGLGAMSEREAEVLLGNLNTGKELVRLRTGIYINPVYIKELYLGD